MKQAATIRAEKRDETSSRLSRQLRKEGYLPGTVYGKDIEAFPVKVKEDEFRKNLSKYGRNYLFNLEVEGQDTYTVMVKEIHHLPLGGKISNIDFHRISLAEEVKLELAIKIIGEERLDSKRLLLTSQINTIPVKGLPQDIPDNIEVDVSDLEDGDKIYVSDINVPNGIEFDIKDDQMVLSVSMLSVKSQDEASEEQVTEDTAEAAAEANEE